MKSIKSKKVDSLNSAFKKQMDRFLKKDLTEFYKNYQADNYDEKAFDFGSFIRYVKNQIECDLGPLVSPLVRFVIENKNLREQQVLFKNIKMAMRKL